ncbi:MAG: acetyltransferase [Proteobacteria bacterium]|nr:acetyltransferase [Pseudomonadota bacterium]MBU1688664.1 acetyltransferase [Pseudomonadota bacterium]
MSQSVIIIGGGGHAKVLIDALRLSGVDILGITDADSTKHAHRIGGVRVLGDDSIISQYGSSEVLLVNGIGSINLPLRRADLFERYKALGYCFTSVIHPSAIIATDVSLGEGVQVMAGAVIQPGCSIGGNCLINTGTTIDHDCWIGDHTHLSPGVTLCGNVTMKGRSFVGAGAIVIQGKNIGSAGLVAAGALVLEDVLDGAVVMGVPANEVEK